MSLTATELRLAFFDYAFEERAGKLCIAHAPAKNKNAFKQKFFDWPNQREGMGSYIDQIRTGNNVWFGVNLFRRPERTTDLALPTRLVWADLDYCNPAEITPAPQCRIESSPNKYQALWRLEELIDPVDAQTFSRRIAYAYADKGADKSGWDISQLLRVPFTFNYKYDDGATHVPEVKLLSSFEARLSVELFKQITEQTPEEEFEDVELPDVLNLPDVSNILYAYQNELRRTSFSDLFLTEPIADWSAAMWQLINICLEVGMTKEETFAIALNSKCNKYDRDSRPISFLWREVLKADEKQAKLTLLLNEATPLKMPVLYEGDQPPSIVNQYMDWATQATDAIPEYHELACCILLSALMAGGLYLETSHGKIIPNLWGLVLGDSTLTRKTTAMRMAMEFIYEIDKEIVVASEGSVEGLFTALAGRPGQVSAFFRDEISGFIDSINRKDYLAGMAETLTQLYDVPEYLPRRLRKETIVVSNPVFIFFGGGIRDKMYGLLNDEHILSGFLPRFLIVGGDADLSKMRPTGPLPPVVGSKRIELRETFINLHSTYNDNTIIEIPEANTVMEIPAQTEVVLTNDAWQYFQKIEQLLAETAHDNPSSMVAQPTFGRLAWSSLKMAMLFAAARQQPRDGKITTGIADLQAAAWFVQKWGAHTIDLIQNVGQSANQRMVQRVFLHIRRRPGCPRSELSRYHHLNKKELDLILETLLDRGQITVRKSGNGTIIEPR